MSSILNHLIIYLSDIFGASNIVNYSIIQQFDISGVSDIVNYLIIQLSDISSIWTIYLIICPMFPTLLTIQLFSYLIFPACPMF